MWNIIILIVDIAHSSGEVRSKFLLLNAENTIWSVAYLDPVETGWNFLPYNGVEVFYESSANQPQSPFSVYSL
jgi:hypothetical protein